MNTPIEVAAVGRVSQLGGLYDARSDKFLHLSLFSNQLPNSSIKATSNREARLKYTLMDSYKEKFQLFDVSASIKISVLSGLISLKGSGKYFKDTKQSARSVKATLFQSFSTAYEEISITDNSVRTVVNMDLLERINDATHVVVGIQWGGNVLVSMENANLEDEDQQQIGGELAIEVKKICDFFDVSGSASVNISLFDKTKINKFSFELYGDILPNSAPTNLFQAIEFMKEAPRLVKEANSGKGKAITYTLIPLSLLRKFWSINLAANTILRQIAEETIHRCVELFDNMNLVEQRLNDLVASAKHFESYLDYSDVRKVKILQLNYNLYQSRLRKNLSEQLFLVRSGNEATDMLEEVIYQSTNHLFSWKVVDQKLDNFTHLQKEILFLKMLTKRNVTLIGKKTIFQQFLWDNFNNDIYILFYNYSQATNMDKYMNQFQEMLESRKDYGPSVIFASSNVKIFASNDNKTKQNETKVSLYRKGKCYLDRYELGSKTDNDNNSPQVWSLFDIQNKLAGQIDEIGRLKVKLNKHESTINEHESTINKRKSEINELIKNPVPIDFIYVQLPNQQSPNRIWPNVGWRDVTSEYKGLFFRAEGGDSLSFGSIQDDNTRRLIRCDTYRGHWRAYDSINFHSDSWSSGIYTGSGAGEDFNMKCLTSGGEVRPRNMAMRIWQRIY